MAAVGEALTESSWNHPVVEYVNKMGADAHPGMKYEASKVLAERAAWTFVERNKASMGFDLVTLCPPWVSTANILLSETENILDRSLV